jgi:hypothetical protein
VNKGTIEAIDDRARSLRRCEELIVFKSVGMALQDLALAARYYELLGGREDFASPSDVATLCAIPRAGRSPPRPDAAASSVAQDRPAPEFPWCVW